MVRRDISAKGTQLIAAVNYVDTFKAPEPGYIGGFFNNRLFYYNTPATPVCECLRSPNPLVGAERKSKRHLTSPTSTRCRVSTSSMVTRSSTRD